MDLGRDRRLSHTRPAADQEEFGLGHGGNVLICPRARSADRSGQSPGAAVGDEVRRAVGAVPLVVAVGRAEVSPATGGLGAVVSPAQAGEVLGPGLAGWSVLVVGVVWSRSQDLASTVHLGKMQWPSRRLTRSRIQLGGSC